MVLGAKPLKKSQNVSSNMSSLPQWFIYISTRENLPKPCKRILLKLKNVGTSLRTLVRGVEINTHQDNFERIF